MMLKCVKGGSRGFARQSEFGEVTRQTRLAIQKPRGTDKTKDTPIMKYAAAEDDTKQKLASTIKESKSVWGIDAVTEAVLVRGVGVEEGWSNQDVMAPGTSSRSPVTLVISFITRLHGYW